ARAGAGPAVAAAAGDLRGSLWQRRPPDLRSPRRPRPARRNGVRRHPPDGGAEADWNAQRLQRRRGGSSRRCHRATRRPHPARARKRHHAGTPDAARAVAERRAPDRRLLQRQPEQHQGGAADAHPPGPRQGSGHRGARRHAGARPHRAGSPPRRRPLRGRRGPFAPGLLREARQGAGRGRRGSGARRRVDRVHRRPCGGGEAGAGPRPSRGRRAGEGIARNEDGAHQRRARRGGRGLMLYNLLFQYSDRFPLFNVLRYPSFRMLMAGLVSLMIGLFLDWKTGALRLDTRLAIPFVKVKTFNPVLPWWIYLPLAFIVIVGTSNAVNLTDGLDGLAIGPTIVSAITFMLLAYLAGATIRGLNIADYLLIPH